MKQEAKKSEEKIPNAPVEHKEFQTYENAWKDPYNYYIGYIVTWYLYLKNCENLSEKFQLHKLIYAEEMKRIGLSI